MDGDAIIQGLIARGYNPLQAAALGGHILQESGGNPSSINQQEGAHGLLQWRLDRWDNLQKFARDNGATPTDPNIQLDFIRHEMAGPEAKAGAAFSSAADLPSASAALKKYIRFGDDSDAVRLNNAKGLLSRLPQVGMINPGTQPQGSLASEAVAPASAAATGSPAQPAADDGNAAFMAQLQAIPKMLAAKSQNQVYAPEAPVANNMAARLAAIAAAKQGTMA